MKLSKVVHLYLEQLEHYNEKIPGNLPKNLQKSWKYHGILSV